MKISSYLKHTRPQSFPVTFFAAFTGYAISPGKPENFQVILVELSLLFMIFSVLLWGGTNAFNSGQDGDSGPLTLLPNPPVVPRYLSAFGLFLMVLAILAAAFVNYKVLSWTVIGVLLSIYYSWKSGLFRRGKDIPVLDMMINTLGFGFCAIIFGFLFTDVSLPSEVVFIGIGFTFAYLGGMPTSQIFQLKQNPEINYTTLLGPTRVLRLGSLFFCLHLFVLGWFYTDLALLKANLLALISWAGWAMLVMAAAIHSFWWSREPFKNPYNRMNRQMIIMMTSQILWTTYAWVKSL